MSRGPAPVTEASTSSSWRSAVPVLSRMLAALAVSLRRVVVTLSEARPVMLVAALPSLSAICQVAVQLPTTMRASAPTTVPNCRLKSRMTMVPLVGASILIEAVSSSSLRRSGSRIWVCGCRARHAGLLDRADIAVGHAARGGQGLDLLLSHGGAAIRGNRDPATETRCCDNFACDFSHSLATACVTLTR